MNICLLIWMATAAPIGFVLIKTTTPLHFSSVEEMGPLGHGTILQGVQATLTSMQLLISMVMEKRIGLLLISIGSCPNNPRYSFEVFNSGLEQSKGTPEIAIEEQDLRLITEYEMMGVYSIIFAAPSF